jgi:signal transduction histidine kinase
MSRYAEQRAFVAWIVLAAAVGAVPVVIHAPQMVLNAGPATARHGIEDALRLLAVSGLFAVLTQLGRRSAEHQKERDEALAAERSRIARELHDVVAHQMTSVVLLSQGANAVLPSDPDQVRGALDDIERTSREALVELRRMLGLLRDDAGDTLGGPQPTLDEVPALVRSIDAFDAAAVNLDLTETVPAGVQLSAYRIVQEAVTNAARYAPGSRVDVALKTVDHRLDVTVSDSGARAGARYAGVAGSGLGLTGMRERAELLGGHLHAGKNGRGWTVTASLPLGDDASV